MLEGDTFPKIEPSKPLATNFTMLWYLSDMGKQWKSKAVFHTYYLKLKRDIEPIPRMTPNTLHRFSPFVKFHTNINFTLCISNAQVRNLKSAQES
jgi:hypothetical protein